MAAKRIYQIAKEFECEEKDIIDFLTSQGIKVGNRLSAVSDDTYSLLRAKYTAPPEPEPAPEPPPPPEPEPAPEPQPNAQNEQAPAQPGKKKKKKNKQPQGDETAQIESETQDASIDKNVPATQAAKGESINAATQAVYREAIAAGNKFIEEYNLGLTKKQAKALKPKLLPLMDSWSILCEHKSVAPDSSPVLYWQAVNKLATKAFKLMNSFGLSHKEGLAEMRNMVNPVGLNYEPREIFSDEENQLFAEQQKFLFQTFGHGMGTINDRLYELKIYAERMKAKFDHMSFLNYVINPADELRSPERVPFNDIADAITHSISGVARRFKFFGANKERIQKILNNFFEWIDGYAKLKEQGAPAEKLAKYLVLEKKFIYLVEFMVFDNLLNARKNKPVPFDLALNLINDYRDNLDDPDAERNFKYKVRGITNLIYKPKEFVFIYQFGDLEPQKDYRPPEEIVAAKAKAVAETEAAENNEE